MKKLLKTLKILLIILVFSFTILTPLVADEKDETIEELTTQLESTNSMLVEVTSQLKQAKEKIKELENQTSPEKEELQKEIKILLTRLEDSTELIKALKLQVEEDQKEIEKLRKELSNCTSINENNKYFGIYAFYMAKMYPEFISGAGVGINFFIPNFPLYVNVGVGFADDVSIMAGLGFRF